MEVVASLFKYHGDWLRHTPGTLPDTPVYRRGELFLCGGAVEEYFDIPPNRQETWAYFDNAKTRPSNAYLKLKVSQGGVKVEGGLRHYKWFATYSTLDEVMNEMGGECWLAIEYRKKA